MSRILPDHGSTRVSISELTMKTDLPVCVWLFMGYAQWNAVRERIRVQDQYHVTTRKPIGALHWYHVTYKLARRCCAWQGCWQAATVWHGANHRLQSGAESRDCLESSAESRDLNTWPCYYVTTSSGGGDWEWRMKKQAADRSGNKWCSSSSSHKEEKDNWNKDNWNNQIGYRILRKTFIPLYDLHLFVHSNSFIG